MTLQNNYMDKNIPIYEMTDFIYKFIKLAKINKEFKVILWINHF